MEFEFRYTNIGFRLYCEMYIAGEFINRVELNGKDEKLYLISLYLNDKYKDELTDYAVKHCKIKCRCFINNEWFEAKGCNIRGIYLIDGCGKIIMNQNDGYILKDLFKMSGYRVELIKTKVIVKKERDYYGKN